MMPVTTAHTTVSMMTAPQRRTGTPSACSVTPEEYMSMVLIDEQLEDGEDQERGHEPARERLRHAELSDADRLGA